MKDLLGYCIDLCSYCIKVLVRNDCLIQSISDSTSIDYIFSVLIF